MFAANCNMRSAGNILKGSKLFPLFSTVTLEFSCLQLILIHVDLFFSISFPYSMNCCLALCYFASTFLSMYHPMMVRGKDDDYYCFKYEVVCAGFLNLNKPYIPYLQFCRIRSLKTRMIKGRRGDTPGAGNKTK